MFAAVPKRKITGVKKIPVPIARIVPRTKIEHFIGDENLEHAVNPYKLRRVMVDGVETNQRVDQPAM